MPVRRFDQESDASAADAERLRLALTILEEIVADRALLGALPVYDQLCPACGDFNFRKRSETADLRGRVALLTGGRVKIGYQAGIKLLRAGAHLIVTTRFPRDSAARYAAEPDFEEWSNRLE